MSKPVSIQSTLHLPSTSSSLSEFHKCYIHEENISTGIMPDTVLRKRYLNSAKFAILTNLLTPLELFLCIVNEINSLVVSGLSSLRTDVVVNCKALRCHVFNDWVLINS